MEVPLADKMMNFSQDNIKYTQQLQLAMSDLLQLALEHQSAGDIEQAMGIYLEIIEIQPRHAEANHNLGLIEVSVIGALAALPRLKIAVQAKPGNEQYRLSYAHAHALLQSGTTVQDSI